MLGCVKFSLRHHGNEYGGGPGPVNKDEQVFRDAGMKREAGEGGGLIVSEPAGIRTTRSAWGWVRAKLNPQTCWSAKHRAPGMTR